MTRLIMQTSAAVIALMVFLINYSEGGELTILSSCICSGYEAVFECIVSDGGATIWSGTALVRCSSDRIILRHSQFYQSGYSISRTCGASGPIVSRAVLVGNDSYTSQFTVNVSHNLVGATIECASDSGSHVGTEQILLTTAPLPPPRKVKLSLINSSHLTFTWNSVAPNCQAVHYKINASNCGQCPTTAFTNSVTCTIPKDIAFEQICTLAVQAVVCRNVPGISSEPVVLVMKVPSAPRMNVTSEYSGETRKLTKISVELITSELDSYNITDITYTINFTDIVSGNTCDSTTLPASSCDNGVCISMFEVSSSLCPLQTDISVSAFASNVFGNGQLSEGIRIDAINSFVDTDFDFMATNAIKCTFINDRVGTPKSCAIEYGPKMETQCKYLSLSSKGYPITSDTVKINLHPSTRYGTEYCYYLTASDGITNIMINGTFAACNPDQLNNGDSAQNDVVCGASYTALGLEKGFICHSGTKVGSTAIHYCYDCGLQKSETPVIRTCGRNGQWNGSIPHCECSQFTASDLALYFSAIGGVIALVFAVSITIFIIAIIILYKAKVTLRKQVQQGKEFESKIYEEIDPISQPKMDTEGNIAYASCHSIMQSVSCAY